MPEVAPGVKPVALLILVAALQLQGCATFRTLDLNKPGYPLVYSGTRLDWYVLQGGCCPQDRFGVMAPGWPGLDLPFSLVMDTVFLPFTAAASVGASVGVQGGF